jgi:hypothetical protein
MPVIPISKVVDPQKENNQKQWWAEQEERYKGSLTSSPPRPKKVFFTKQSACKSKISNIAILFIGFTGSRRLVRNRVHGTSEKIKFSSGAKNMSVDI